MGESSGELSWEVFECLALEGVKNSVWLISTGDAKTGNSYSASLPVPPEYGSQESGWVLIDRVPVVLVLPVVRWLPVLTLWATSMVPAILSIASVSAVRTDVKDLLCVPYTLEVLLETDLPCSFESERDLGEFRSGDAECMLS